MLTEFIRAVSEELQDHWIKILTAAAFMVVGWYFGRRRERRDWLKREFMDRLNISLNQITDGTLRIRTLIEKDAEDIFLNKHAVKTLQSYASKTTPGRPIIPVPKDDCWYFLNAVLNEISENYSAGQIAQEAGLPVTPVTFLVCLTNEAEGDVRTRKMRAMVVRKDLLLKLPSEMPKLESPNHKTRWGTLQAMAKAYAETPYQFCEVDIIIPR